MCEHRRWTNSFRYAVSTTGVDQGRASRNVHDTKAATGCGGADNVKLYLDCWAIIAPETDEVIGHLFDEALRKHIQSMSKGTQMVSTKASFRIIGKDLDPSEITNLLHMHPDQLHRCGDPNMSKSGRSFASSERIWTKLNAQCRHGYCFELVSPSYQVWNSSRIRAVGVCWNISSRI